MRKLWISKLIAATVGLVIAMPFNTMACTGIQLKAKDGSFVNGRTVEFGQPLNLMGLIIPRHYEFKGTMPDGSAGLVYRSKYAVIGGSAYGAPSVVDGLNEKGLTAAVFYFPGYASYSEATEKNKSMALAPNELTNWILTQFATVDEVKQAIPTVIVVPTAPAGWGGVPPFHYVVYDKSGESIVIEPLNGKLVVTDNPIGVITNSPTFDWHLTNLSNYINLSPVNAPVKSIDRYPLAQFGQGSGLHGMPGDFTPPSRFIRAAIFSAAAIPADNAVLSVWNVFHLLNQFDIPAGSVRADNKGKVIFDTTIATTVKDPVNLNYYFKTYDDQTIKMISLSKFDLDNKKLQSIAMKGSQTINDVSITVQPWQSPPPPTENIKITHTPNQK